MINKELIEILKTLPQDMEVCMADLSPITLIKQVKYGNGVICISDYEEEE